MLRVILFRRCLKKVIVTILVINLSFAQRFIAIKLVRVVNGQNSKQNFLLLMILLLMKGLSKVDNICYNKLIGAIIDD